MNILGPRHFERWVVDGRIGHDLAYWQDRDVWLDCRGPLSIHPASVWGYNVTVITASHSLRPEDEFTHRFWPVIVEADAWVCSNTVLYNCRIGAGAIVAAGCVVRSRDVPAGAMVEGNPAQVVAEYRDGHWVHLDDPYPLPTHAQAGGHDPGLTMAEVQAEFE